MPFYTVGIILNAVKKKNWKEEITKFRTPTTKRIYADWTKPNAGG